MRSNRGSTMVARAAALTAPPLLVMIFGIAMAQRKPPTPSEIFRTADACMSCHNGLSAPSGEDVSIGTDWRASMMANAARDPYWHAAVRREIMDFPDEAAEIENECVTCHMPMSSFEARQAGEMSEMFALLPVGESGHPLAKLAADGVSCTICHQISQDGMGEPETFTGRFRIDMTHPWESRRIFGPFPVDSGRARIMRSASAYTPTQTTHIQSSGVCASCHVLYTHARAPEGTGVGMFPEQTPYLEWEHSAFREERSCQSCHMPVVEQSTPITSILGVARPGFSRHTFVGGNFFMLRMLNRYRDELGVEALPGDLEAAAVRALDHLATSAAELTIESVRRSGRGILAVVNVRNLAGHKLPTAYPSRRVWLRLVVYDAAGRAVFESGAIMPDGSIHGNDNDADPARYEPHYQEISSPEQVQIYESVMGDVRGRVTTGLLSGVAYLKDNRVLPRGFDKATAAPDIAVYGAAAGDSDFVESADQVRYRMDVGGASGPLRVEAELWYQPIGFRWAENLKDYEALETDRFVRYYESMSSASAARLARAEATVN